MASGIDAKHDSLISVLQLREHKVNTIAGVSCCTAFYIFCWLGLGTPFIWLKHYDPLNAKIYEIIKYGTLLLVSLIFFSVCLFKFRQVVKCVRNSKFALLFIGFISLSLVWSPVGIFEKASLGFSLGICITGAFAALVCIGWGKSWAVVMFAMCGIMFPTLVFEFVPHHPTLKVIAITYSGGLISFLILTLSFTSSTNKKSRLFNLIAAVGIFIGMGMMIFPIIEDVSSVIENATTTIKPWSPKWRLSSWGLFINPNLYNRALQILLIASFITTLSFGTFSKNPRTGISTLSLMIAIVCTFALFEHRASTGRLVLVVVSVAFIVLLIWKELRFRFLFLSTINLHSLAFGLCLAIAITSVIAILKLDNFVTAYLDSALARYGELGTRLQIWRLALPLLQGEAVWFGDGLSGFWAGEPKLASQVPYLNSQAHAHSGLVDLILQAGVFGCVLFWVAVTLKSFRIITDRGKGSFVAVTTSLMAITGLLSMNLFESALLPVSSAAMLPFTLVLVFLFRPTNDL